MRGKDIWPRLSETLQFDQDPATCQSCGMGPANTDHPGWALSRWQEHDWADRPDPIIVVLCASCSDLIIEPHPRLYRRLDRNEPWPGCMDLCTGCFHQEGVTCTHPDLKANGGPGLEIEIPKPNRIHVLYADKRGQRHGEWRLMYPGPPISCAGYIARAPEVDPE